MAPPLMLRDRQAPQHPTPDFYSFLVIIRVNCFTYCTYVDIIPWIQTVMYGRRERGSRASTLRPGVGASLSRGIVPQEPLQGSAVTPPGHTLARPLGKSSRMRKHLRPCPRGAGVTGQLSQAISVSGVIRREESPTYTPQECARHLLLEHYGSRCACLLLVMACRRCSRAVGGVARPWEV